MCHPGAIRIELVCHFDTPGSSFKIQVNKHIQCILILKTNGIFRIQISKKSQSVKTSI